MNLTNIIKRLRESKGIRQEELAERLNTTRSNYAYLEKRGNKLTIEQLEKIAEALEVGLLELLTGEPPTAVDSGKVKELEARVQELEDRIKDKMVIINRLKEDAERRVKEFRWLIEIEIKRIVIKLEIGTQFVTLGKAKDRIILSNRMSEAKFKHFDFDALRKLEEKDINKLPSLSQEKNLEFFCHDSSFLWLGEITPNNREEYENHFSYSGYYGDGYYDDIEGIHVIKCIGLTNEEKDKIVDVLYKEQYGRINALNEIAKIDFITKGFEKRNPL